MMNDITLIGDTKKSPLGGLEVINMKDLTN